MSNRRDSFTSSSPSKMFDQYIDQAFENTAGTSSNNTSNTMSNLQFNTPTGFTPFFDRQSNSISFHKSPQQSKQIHQQLLYQQRQIQQLPQTQSSQQQQIPAYAPSQSRGQLHYLNQSYINYEPGSHPIIASSPQRPSDIFNYNELLQSTTTPVAERSFKVSDFFVDTPTLNQYDLDALLGEVSKENSNGINDFNSMNINGTNVSNVGFLSNFGTPIEKLNMFFKTPLHEYSGSKIRNNSTTTSNGNSIKRSLNFANVTSTPGKGDKFTTPLKKNADQSSPSTIIIGSAAKADASTRLQMSPTPVAKSSVKAPVCQLVKSNSSLEPVIGIFQDQNKLPPSFGSVASKKTNTQDILGDDKLLQQKQQNQLSSSSLSSSQHSYQQTQTDSFSKKRGNDDMASGMSKFQIVFADVKNFKNSTKTKKRKTMNRSNTTMSVISKKKQTPQLHNYQNHQRQTNQESQNLQLQQTEESKSGSSLVRYATDPSFSHSSSGNVSALTDITNSSRNNIKSNHHDPTSEDTFKPVNRLNLSPIKFDELSYNTTPYRHSNTK